MKKYKIAVLDDYQNVALESADWSVLRDRADIAVFRESSAAEDSRARLERAYRRGVEAASMFGKMAPKERGKLLLIHVDCHLKQFAG
jgi:hypothetical protein